MANVVFARRARQPRVVEDPGMHRRLLHGNREISIAGFFTTLDESDLSIAFIVGYGPRPSQRWPHHG
jgi:hypothetical protein